MSKINFLLDHVPFFLDLNPSEIEPLLPLFHEKKYKKGSTIFFEGDVGEELFIIQSGTVKIFRFDGLKEFILAIFREGDYFGEMALLEKESRYRSATAEALEATTLYVLNRSSFYHFLESNNKLTLKLLQITTERLRKANEKIEDLTFLDVRSRILKNIVRLSKDYGVETKEGILVDFKITHQQLADMVGAVRETVTKVLLELQDEQLIHIDKKKILIINSTLLEQKIAYH